MVDNSALETIVYKNIFLSCKNSICCFFLKGYILGNGSLLASGESASVETKSEVPESVIIYKIGDVEELTFCHVPTAAEFCKRMVASEKIRELLNEMKPWGESESIIIPVVISAGEEVYEGTFKCVYKKSL